VRDAEKGWRYKALGKAGGAETKLRGKTKSKTNTMCSKAQD
jgi:hypothetical protein